MAFTFAAAYRPLVLKPPDVKWRFERYYDKALSLIPSDLDRMKNTRPVCPAVKGNAHELVSYYEFLLKTLTIFFYKTLNAFKFVRKHI